MATFTEDQVRQRARQRTGRPSIATASAVLTASVRSAPSSATFDVFLSHSTRDAEIVLGVKLMLEDQNRTVYVDWIEDPQLDHRNVTPRTAEVLRERMRACRSLVYVHTENSGSSKWMPWELGFSDAHHGAVAILPVTRTAQQNFAGQEYLGLYPWMDEGVTTLASRGLRIHRSPTDYREWRTWVQAPRSFRKAA